MATTLHPDQSIRKGYRIPPDGVAIVGYDTPHGPSHPYYDARVARLGVLDKAGFCYDPEQEDGTGDRGEMHALCRSLHTQGQLQSVSVRRDGDLLLVGWGRRRVYALRKVNAYLVATGQPPRVLDVEYDTTRSPSETMIAAVAENEQRSGNLPSERAAIFAHAERHGASRAEIAEAAGLTAQTVGRYITLHGLAPALKRLADSGKVSVERAIQMAGLSLDKQKEAAEDIETAPEPARSYPKRRRLTVGKLARLRDEATDEGARVALTWLTGEESTIPAIPDEQAPAALRALLLAMGGEVGDE